MGDRFSPEKFGIFSDSEALGQMYEMDVEQHPDYLTKRRTCEVCNRTVECHMSWGELFCLASGLFPQTVAQVARQPTLFGNTEWVYNNALQCFHPRFYHGCSQSALVVFDMTPTEAERLLSQASKNGVISERQRGLINAIQPAIAHLRSRSYT